MPDRVEDVGQLSLTADEARHLRWLSERPDRPVMATTVWRPGVRLRSVRWSGQGRIVRAVMRPSAANWKWNLRLTGLPGKSPAMSAAASWPVVVALTSRRV